MESITEKARDQGNLTDNKDGTVTDNVTGLVWQQGQSVAMTWDDAVAYAKGLTLGGHSDWRLPSKDELESLFDKSRVAPTFDPLYFPNTNASCYWSSSTRAYDTNHAWAVYFHFGSFHYCYKSDYYYVRCVRGKQ